MDKITTRQHIFAIILIMMPFLIGQAVASLLSWVAIGTASNMSLSVFFIVYMTIGMIGFVQRPPSDVRSLLKAIRNGSIWPYLVWKNRK